MEVSAEKQKKTPQEPIRPPQHPDKQPQQQGTEGPGVQGGPQNHAQQHEQPQLPRPHIECQEQQRREQRQHEQQIQKRGQAGMQPPLGPKYIVLHTQKGSQQQTAAQLSQLQQDRQLHQRTSRCSRPPFARSRA